LTSSSAFEAPVLSVRDLSVRYGTTWALRDVSVAVSKGAVYSLLGRNGAGKTSLIRCLLGQQKPTAGNCMLLGESSWRARARAMARLGVVPEEPDAPPEMTARQLAAFHETLYPKWDGISVFARLERFDVPPAIPFGRLSKGQKGLVSLALALASQPELLVLDDPTLDFDAIARKALFEELADRGTTVFLTTHDLAGVEGMASRVGVLRDGKLILDEDLEELKARFRRIRYANEATGERTEYGRELEAFDAVRVKVRGWGVEAIVSNFEESSFQSFRAIEGVVDAEASALSLEEIFIAVAGETPSPRERNP
jgi:ABC-2 type transport system ATP-binding protein